jgi:hypothetical protein
MLFEEYYLPASPGLEMWFFVRVVSPFDLLDAICPPPTIPCRHLDARHRLLLPTTVFETPQAIRESAAHCRVGGATVFAMRLSNS